MKKALVLFIAIAMAFCLNSLPVVADDEVEFYITAPESASIGDTIEVVFGVTGSYEAHVLDAKVEFDVRSLEYVETRNGDALTATAISGGASSLYDLTADGTAVSLGVMMLIAPMTAQGDLIVMTFRVLDTADSSADFNIEVDMFGYMPVGENSSTPIEYTCSNASTALNGSSGQGNNDEGVSNTPRPITTDAPQTTSVPETTSVPDATDTPSDVTNVPDITEDSPSRNETELPDGSTDVEATENIDDGVVAVPGNDDKDGGLDTTAIILICVGAVILLGAAGFVVAKILKKKSAGK